MADYGGFACGVYPIWDFFSDVYVHVFGQIWRIAVIISWYTFLGSPFLPESSVHTDLQLSPTGPETLPVC